MGLRSYSLSQALTASAPSQATDGVALDDAAGFRVTLKGDAGNLTGGALLAYYYDANNGWTRNPDLDLTVAAGPNAKQTFPDQAVFARFGRVAYVPSAVTVSAGTTVTVRVDAWGYAV